MTSNLGEDVLCERDGALQVISLNRPASKNGLTVEVNQRLLDLLKQAAQDTSVRALALCGRGGNFCSGLDLKAAMSMAQEQGGLSRREEQMRVYFHGLIRAIVALDQPVVAVVDGPAVGFGLDLALCCDVRVATPRARFGAVFVRRGLMPDGGGTYSLPRLVGLGRALDLLLTGDVIDAEEALRIGLVSRIVKDEAEGLSLAHRLAAGPPLVMRNIKRAVYESLGGDLNEALDREGRGQMELLMSQDFVEGLSAFFMKREPHFTGK